MAIWTDRVATIAEERRLTYAELARQIDVPEQRFRKWFSARTENPRGPVIEELARVLDVNVVWLRYGTGPRDRGESTDAHPEIVTTDEIGARNDFGGRMAGCRVRLKLTVAQACKGLMISQARWQALEDGAATPALIELQVISERLRESLDWLVSGYVQPIENRSQIDTERVRMMLHEGNAGFSGTTK